MTYEFITTTDELKEIVVTTARYKRENSLYLRLVKEADKFFGKDNWSKIPNYDNSLANTLGWYARRKDGYDSLEARPVF